MEVAEWAERQFVYCERIGIPVPALQEDWEELTLERQQAVLARWEMIRGSIPRQVQTLEARIRAEQQKLDEEEDFAESCRLNAYIAELASCINELHIWFRVQQELSEADRLHY